MTGPKTVESLQPGDIAYISCELSDYSDNDIDAANTINLAVNNKPNAIVLYSEHAASRLFIPSEDFQYLSMYSMQNASSSAAIVDGLLKNNPPYPDTSISVNQSSSAFATKDQSSSSGITKTIKLVIGLVVGIVNSIAMFVLGLSYFCIMRRRRRKKQQLTEADMNVNGTAGGGGNVESYFQQKADLDDEQRRHEMEAVEVRYEMDGEDEIHEMSVEERETHCGRQEL